MLVQQRFSCLARGGRSLALLKQAKTELFHDGWKEQLVVGILKDKPRSWLYIKRARTGFQQALHQPQQRALARTIGAHQADPRLWQGHAE